MSQQRQATWVPQHHRDITLGRFDGFVSDGMFSDVNLRHDMYLGRDSSCVQLEVYNVPPGSPHPTYDDVIHQQFVPCQVGDAFGPSWSTHWFKVTMKVPDQWGSLEGPLMFVWDSGCEAMVWREGEPVQGLTDQRNEYKLADRGTPGQVEVLYVEMACNTMFGNGPDPSILPPEENRTYRLSRVELAVRNEAVWELYYSFLAVADIARTLPADSPAAAEALFTANQMINTYRSGDSQAVTDATALAKRFLHSTMGASRRHSVFAVGHCHIDTAWLWPFEETHRKVARSWSSQLVLMDKYPEHKFACSTAQQYKWLKEDYPGLFSRVTSYVRSGQFVPVGGTWVEMDCNMPSGESLVRQFLMGQRFFERELGGRCDVFWLPDTFGYAAQLPQIVLGAGMRYFLTQKLSWNNINTFPHNTFYWEALDGSRVLTHFPPANTYNAQCNVGELLMSSSNNKDKDRAPCSLMLFGNGDGGGGPTEAMLESLRRIKDVDGLVPVDVIGPGEFFKKLEESCHDVLTWQGELYFELHRGTYTSHAANKYFNRKCELMLRDVELLSALAVCLDPQPTTELQAVQGPSKAGHQYPHEALTSIWQDVLLFQFHDVLPGSAIHRVYEESQTRYKQMVEDLGGLRTDSLGALLHQVGKTSQRLLALGGDLSAMDPEHHQDKEEVREREDTAPLSGPTTYFFNTLGCVRNEVVEVSAADISRHGALAREGCQVLSKDSALLQVQVPPLALQGSDPEAGLAGHGPAQVTTTEGGGFVMENDWLRVALDPHGQLTSLWDKRWQRELVPEGALGNKFRYFEDIPLFWDAWDVEIYHLEKGRDAGLGDAKVVEEGPVRCAIEVAVPLSVRSTMTMIISLTAVKPRLDFQCNIDWDENRQVLKVEFPWALHSPVATYETQFGALQRPTHQNTSWDWAKFEVCAHRFADLSEYGYGVALLNDCKYGHATHGNVMRLTLLRAPKAPDASTDIGHHVIKYAIYPHAGGWQASGVVFQALAFNVPLLQACSLQGGEGDQEPTPDGVTRLDMEMRKEESLQCFGALPVGVSLLKVESLGPTEHPEVPCLVLDTIKLAEPPISKGTEAAGPAMVVRLYEPHGGRGTAALSWWEGLRVERVTQCNLLEDDLEELIVGKSPTGMRGCSVSYTPFKVITLKLILASQPVSPSISKASSFELVGDKEIDWKAERQRGCVPS